MSRKSCSVNCNCKRHTTNHKRRSWTQEDKIKHSELMKTYWSNLEYKRLNMYKRKRPTSIEQILVNNLEIMYGPDLIIPEYGILEFSVDCAVPYLRLVFEADGTYWHQNKEKDTARQQKIESEGWQVIRYSEQELLKWGNVKSITKFSLPTRRKCSKNCTCGRHNRKGKTHEEIYGIEKSAALKANLSIKISTILTGKNLSEQHKSAISHSMQGKHWKWKKNLVNSSDIIKYAA